jgi:NAD(P)-dependent dehydrogenase (short-subunit alcohol dehydrogenase family)
MNMRGKTIVMTGATSGIGAVAAERLASMGARIVLVARDRARTEETMTRLRRAAPDVQHAAHFADLLLMADVKRVAAEIAAQEPRIDVLVNNAGAMFTRRETTAEGLERTFALNHMAYFVLTAGLRERLAASAPARIVSTASAAHLRARLDFDNLQLERGFGPMKAYSRSKLCNILFTRDLARRLEGSGVTANCLHPGFVATRFGDNSGGVISRFVGLAKLFAISPEEGADTIVHLASSPDVAATSGAYFYRRRPGKLSDAARDDGAARKLWDVGTQIAGL